MAPHKPTIVIIVLATFSVSHSLRIASKRQPIAAQDSEDGTLQHDVSHCPDVKSAYTRNLVMMATCEREYQEDTVKINKLEEALGLQLVTTPDELDRRQQHFQEYLSVRSGISCEDMVAAKVGQDKMIVQYGSMKYYNLATIKHLNAQFTAHLHAQGDEQALVKSKFTRRNEMIDACEKGYHQDVDKIAELQANLVDIQQLAEGDELYRLLCLEDRKESKGRGKRGCEEMQAAKVIKGELIQTKFVEERAEIHGCIEELKKELDGGRERDFTEMEGAKDIQGKLIGKYKEMKYLNLATIEDLTAQINAQLIPQNERQAQMRSELARRNRIIEDYEKEYAQDALKINDLQAALGIKKLTAADKLHLRVLRIEELKKEFNCCSTRSYEEMEAAKDLQEELIGKYGELKHDCLALINALEGESDGEGKAKKLRGKGEGKATVQNQGAF